MTKFIVIIHFVINDKIQSTFLVVSKNFTSYFSFGAKNSKSKARNGKGMIRRVE